MWGKFTVRGTPFLQMLPGPGAVVSLWGHRAQVPGWAEWGPCGSGERMGLQETPPFSWGPELKHRQALCRVTRGQQGGTVPGLELVSQASVLVSGFASQWKVLTGQFSFTPGLWGCGSWQGEGRNLAGKPPPHLPAHTSPASSAPGAGWVGLRVGTLTQVRGWSGQCLQVMPDEVGLAQGPGAVCLGTCWALQWEVAWRSVPIAGDSLEERTASWN